ncbi:hypothetical protein OKA05_28175 [Luteolibacter arcticus]|uniref:Uncharacterized protein n=1 Tax=Luteolibacter arcticus TaxID=1581411 RepID=A0ABT3GSG3_9BACT|nr:hypothetical protein [Luteolibacter arcticus]MCW1926461.1 hypothetical protein [Luteolibacter arcticus]
MKTSVAILLAAFSSIAFAEPPASGGLGIEHLPKDLKPPVGKAISDKDLKSRQQGEKFGGFAKAGTEPQGWDLEKNSEFITFEGAVTLVPKGSILHIPDRYRANVVSAMKGNFMLWSEFSARYRGLVGSFEVSMPEASGETEIKPERLEVARKTGLILVGTLNHNPISVTKRTPPANAAAPSAR